MQVLQLFHRYLDNSSHWIHDLLWPLPAGNLRLAAPVWLNPEYQLEAVERVVIPHRLGVPIQQNLWFRLKVRRNKTAIKRWMENNAAAFGLAHAHFAFVGWEYAKLCHRLGKPLLVSFYGFDYEHLPHTQPLWRDRYRELMQLAAGFVAEGPHGAETLQRMGCPASKIHIVPLGVEIPLILPPPKTKPTGQLNLIQAATFKEKKGHRYTLLAMAEAVKQCPDIRLTMVGDGPLLPETMQLSAQLGLADRVTFLPPLPYQELKQLLGHYDTLVQPSLYTTDKDSEGGAPVVLLDAQLAGLPVLTTAHADIPNRMLANQTGLLANEKDIAAMADAMVHLTCMLPERYTAMSRAAIRFVAENFDRNKASAGLQNLYERFT